MVPPDEDLGSDAQYTVFHPSEVEFVDTVSAITKQVEAENPHRIVFDCLSEFRMLARDPLALSATNPRAEAGILPVERQARASACG